MYSSTTKTLIRRIAMVMLVGFTAGMAQQLTAATIAVVPTAKTVTCCVPATWTTDGITKQLQDEPTLTAVRVRIIKPVRRPYPLRRHPYRWVRPRIIIGANTNSDGHCDESLASASVSQRVGNQSLFEGSPHEA